MVLFGSRSFHDTISPSRSSHSCSKQALGQRKAAISRSNPESKTAPRSQYTTRSGKNSQITNFVLTVCSYAMARSAQLAQHLARTENDRGEKVAHFNGLACDSGRPRGPQKNHQYSFSVIDFGTGFSVQISGPFSDTDFEERFHMPISVI
jgi:hypothetical protein